MQKPSASALIKQIANQQSAHVAKVASKVAAQVSTQEAARLAKWPGTPTWVRSFEDYRRWQTVRSKEKGYQSTIMTSTTGLTDEEMTSNLKVTSLSG